MSVCFEQDPSIACAEFEGERESLGYFLVHFEARVLSAGSNSSNVASINACFLAFSYFECLRKSPIKGVNSPKVLANADFPAISLFQSLSKNSLFPKPTGSLGKLRCFSSMEYYTFQENRILEKAETLTTLDVPGVLPTPVEVEYYALFAINDSMCYANS